MAAEARSLVEWINSFGEGTCESLGELSEGTLLFKCIHNVIPDLSSGEENDEWSALFHVLTEFCGCSLEQSVDRELIEEGDEEHIARAVVLLLCLAVQRKPNEDVISHITTLHYKAQCDIMFFIEEALAKMRSNALSSGLFTSGVGDVVPALTDEGTAVEGEVNEAMEEGEGEEEACGGHQAECPSQSGCGSSASDSTPKPTPNRVPKTPSRPNLFMHPPSSVPRSLSRHKMRQSYYQGLDSPAAVQWMQSQRPAARPPMNDAPAPPEEVLKLQHKVRVLEKSLHNEQTLSQEMHAALCQREREYCDLEASYQKVHVMVDKAKELVDVQDELQVMTAALEKSDRSVQHLQREMEEERGRRDQEMEQRLSHISRLEAENTQLKELLERAVAGELEQKSEVKRLQLSSETAAIAFQAKERECDSLLQLNQEHCADIREMKQQSASLQQALARLQETCDEKEKVLTKENQALSLTATQTQEQLARLQDEHKVLVGECESLRQQVTVSEAGSRAVMEQYQTTVREMEARRTHCKVVESQLGESAEQLQEAKTELRKREAELSDLQNHLIVMKTAAREECGKVQEQLVEKEAAYLDLQQSSTEKIKSLEECLVAVQNEFAVKEEEMCALRNMSSQQIQKLQEDLQQVCDELTGKEAEFCSLTQIVEEQKNQAEEMLSDARQNLNSLQERYTTETEEMAAVKASLEEDLARVQHALAVREGRLAERETEVQSKENEIETLNKELQGLHKTVEVLEKEKLDIKEEREKIVNQLQGMSAWMKEKELRWSAEKQELENITAKLRSEVESMVQALRSAGREHEHKQAMWEEEKESWLIQVALLEEQVAGLTEEVETTAGKSRDLEGEVERLGGAVKEGQSTVHALQATLSEARAECEKEREEGVRREAVLTASVETLTRQLAEVGGERDRVQKESEQLSRKYAEIEAEYQTSLAESERGHQLYSTELKALQDTNSLLQLKQDEASAENEAILSKQSELYKELSALQQTKSEMMDLCRQYENAYNEEMQRHQADREQIKKMRMQSFNASASATSETNSLRKQLSAEKRTTARLGAENKSLKAQLSYLEQKLRDMEKDVSPPKLPQRRPHRTFIAPPHPSSSALSSSIAQPNTEEFYSQLQHEFDSFTATQIPIDISDSPSHTTTFKEEVSEVTFSGSDFPGPQHHSTTVKPPAQQMLVAGGVCVPQMSQTAKDRQQGIRHGPGDDKNRITELKHRNSRVLPHLKSSYAVEMQEKVEDPCILNERASQLRRKRAAGNDSCRLTLSRGQVAKDGEFEESRKRTITSRKATGDLGFSGSPVAIRRRISEPLTPQQNASSVPPTEVDPKWEDPRRATMASGFPLREYLNNDDANPAESEGRPSTMFELNFSPPHTKAVPPERLTQRLSKQEKPAKPATTTPSQARATRATASGRKTAGAGKNLQQRATSKRTALKTKN